MSVRFQDEAFPILKKYLYYLQTVRQKSVKTVDEYFIDLRTFFRYLKRARKLVPDDMEGFESERFFQLHFKKRALPFPEPYRRA